MVKRPDRVLMLLPDRDFDPTEAAVSWEAFLKTCGNLLVSAHATNALLGGSG